MATTCTEHHQTTPSPGLRDWRDVIASPFPSFGAITEETREMTRRHSRRFRGSVRMSTARYFTSEEFEQRRKEVLAKQLP